jgi:hypothetical protein
MLAVGSGGDLADVALGTHLLHLEAPDRVLLLDELEGYDWLDYRQ